MVFKKVHHSRDMYSDLIFHFLNSIYQLVCLYQSAIPDICTKFSHKHGIVLAILSMDLRIYSYMASITTAKNSTSYLVRPTSLHLYCCVILSSLLYQTPLGSTDEVLQITFLNFYQNCLILMDLGRTDIFTMQKVSVHKHKPSIQFFLSVFQ